MMVVLLGALSRALWAQDVTPPQTSGDMSPKQLFETNCSACHSLDLPRSQHLDRQTWRWVMDDMVNEFGATWITETQQRKIIDYLVEHHGPQ